jgi:hypothetical protein
LTYKPFIHNCNRKKRRADFERDAGRASLIGGSTKLQRVAMLATTRRGNFLLSLESHLLGRRLSRALELGYKAIESELREMRYTLLGLFLWSSLGSTMLFGIDNMKLNPRLDYNSDSLDGPLITGNDASPDLFQDARTT